METRFPEMEAVELPQEMKAPLMALSNAAKRLGNCPLIGRDENLIASVMCSGLETTWDHIADGINGQYAEGGVPTEAIANALSNFIAGVLSNIQDEAVYELIAQSLISATLDRDTHKMIRAMMATQEGQVQ
jgi:hypothetical protein